MSDDNRMPVRLQGSIRALPVVYQNPTIGGLPILNMDLVDVPTGIQTCPRCGYVRCRFGTCHNIACVPPAEQEHCACLSSPLRMRNAP